MKVQLNILPFIGALAAMFVTFSIMNGTAQEVVHFADPLNEMATAFLTLMLTLIGFVMSFESIKKIKE
jgi:mannose/fructose/N-acetylgalactosamine-specific phosphotransferase system component IID